MPLFRASGDQRVKAQPKWRKTRRSRVMDEDDSVPTLTRLCLLSLADNMKNVWVKDYADNYMDHYSFRHIMGPFNLLSGELVEELTRLLCSRRKLSRAALHLLIVPQLRGLTLETCPGLVTSALCTMITARCQGLRNLSLSGAQQLPSRALSDTLRCLPALRSLSLAGTSCDASVIKTIILCCPLLRHLDVSGCHLLSPAALLPLGGFSSLSKCSPSGSSSSTSASPLRLCSLLALDIGFGEEEGDLPALVAYLLLALPYLERLAVENLLQACWMIQHRDFTKVDAFAGRERLPRLEEVWRESRRAQQTSKTASVEAQDVSESEDDEEGCSQNDTSEIGSDDRLTLRLRDVKGLTCESLDSFGCLCPNITSIAVRVEEEEDDGGRSLPSLLAKGLQSWSGQLRSLSVQHQGPLQDLLPALQVSGSSLVSLTLEGVKTNTQSPLLELIWACPKLKDLLIRAEPPTLALHGEPDERELPSLPNLCSLTLNFSYEHHQTRPPMSWMSLMRVIYCLLTGSPLLQRLSLVSLPCPLNRILQNVLWSGFRHRSVGASAHCVLKPLERVTHLDLQRTDVQMITVKGIMQQSKRLKCVDVSRCWQISHMQWTECKRSSRAQVVWV